MVPRLDIAPLFGGPSPERDAVDRAIMAVSGEIGFMSVHGLPTRIPLSRSHRHALLRIFGLPDETLRPMWRQKFDPDRPNLYRGWFPAQVGALSYKRGIDMGPDVAYGLGVVAPGDPLREATPLPGEEALPGWAAAVTDYYRGMEETGRVLMQALARGMGLDGHVFDAAFEGGVSTLRLIQYPPRPVEALAALPETEVWVEHAGGRYQVVGKAHVDSGLVTLLAQDGVEGLQACDRSGEWRDVPPSEETLVVNFGKLLERWTHGRVRATEHRVIGSGRVRHSIAFFYEPDVDAEISAQPGDPYFEPFLYGDHLWQATTQFVEFEGMEGLRPPRGAVAFRG